jgi:hypothetical protein
VLDMFSGSMVGLRTSHSSSSILVLSPWLPEIQPVPADDTAARYTLV